MQHFVPRSHQTPIIDALLNNDIHQIWCEAGSGKTVCVLWNIYQRMLDLDNYKSIIVAPRTSIDLTWPNEIENWSFMKGFKYADLRTPEGVEAWMQNTADIYLINYDRLEFLDSLVRKKQSAFTIYFDEITKMKNPSSNRAKFWNGNHHVPKHDDSLRRRFHRVYGLTGTPALNHLKDLFGQVLAIDQGLRLGRFKTNFESRYFEKSYNGYSLKPKDTSLQDILALIQDITLSMPPVAGVGVGPINYVDVEVKLPASVTKIYKEAQRDFLIQLQNKDIPAITIAVLLDKLQQLTSGCVYATEQDQTKSSHAVHDCKLDALDKLAQEGNPLLVFYKYKQEEKRLLERFKFAESLDSRTDCLERWNQGKIKMLLAHPASAAHSLNLQFGGCDVVWFSLCHSGENYSQANSRLQRMGQTNIVNVHRLLCPRTIDEAIADALRRKFETDGSVKEVVRNLKRIAKL